MQKKGKVCLPVRIRAIVTEKMQLGCDAGLVFRVKDRVLFDFIQGLLDDEIVSDRGI
jgi:hypothetical protein